MTEFMMIGEVLKPQGVRGEAKVRSYASDPDSFKRWNTLYLLRDGAYMPVAARCSRVNDGFAYVTLDGCANPDDVEKLRGQQLYIDRAHAARLRAGEVYVCDLIGCEAVTADGTVLGKLTDVLQNSPVDVYVFKTPSGSMMAPALKAVFTEVDVEGRRIVTDVERLNEVAVVED